jgi:Tfp pilus assembly protein PilZ
VRLDTSLDVIVETSPVEGSGERREKVTALSEYGMFVSSQRPLPYGSISPFTLLLDRAVTARKIKVEGKILYSYTDTGSGKSPGMGVKFTGIRADDREAIRNFISEQLMAGLATPIKTSV